MLIAFKEAKMKVNSESYYWKDVDSYAIALKMH